MLKIIRRVFSFADWSRTHPGAPHPGDMLDAQFDEIIDKVDEWDTRVRRAINEDGKIAYGAIDNQSVIPAIATAVHAEALDKIRDQIAAVDRAARLAKQAKDEAEAALIRAGALAAKAELLSGQLLPAQVAANEQAHELTQKAADLFAQAKGLQDDWTNAQKEAFSADQNAMLWAEVSQQWAEYMPGPLPNDTLAWMEITGDHWSARWWANQAANAFGEMVGLYFGALPEPPLVASDGGPIQPGSIYFDTDPPPGQMFVWNGSSWVPLWAPQRSVMATLTYDTTASQTVQSLTDPDINGDSYTIKATQPEAVDVHLNGVRLVHTGSGATGDYTINNATSTITFARPIPIGGVLAIDILMPEARMAGGQVQAWALNPITTFNGTTKTFTLTAKNPAIPVNIQRSEELLVSLNDVIQEPGVDFTALVDQITFLVAPPASTPNFITWFQGMGTASGGSVAWGDITGKPGTFPPSVSSALPVMDGTALAGVSTLAARGDHVHPTDTSRAPLASPTFTGDPKAPTPLAADNDTSIATTAFVKAQGYVTGSYLPMTGGVLTGELTAPTLRLTSTGDASMLSTTHAFQVGLDTSTNLIIDQNEVMVRANGANASLNLNLDGGDVVMGNSASTVSARGPFVAPSLNGFPTDQANVANTIAVRSGNDIFARLFRSEYASTTATCAYFMGQVAVGAGADNYIRPMTIAQAAALLDASLVPVGRTVTAGNGLTGGGALSANVTLTVGTPGTISGASTNSVTSTSHTHAWDWGYSGTSASNLTYDIGSYIILFNQTGGTNPARNASMVVYLAADWNHRFTNASGASAGTVAGTWRARGQIDGDGGYILMQRTA